LFKGVFRKKTPDPIPAPIPEPSPGPVFPESVEEIRQPTPVVPEPVPAPAPAPVVPEPVPEPAPAVTPVVPEPVPAPFVPEPEIAPIVPEPVPAPVVPETEERTIFGPQPSRSLQERLRAAKEKAAQMKRGTISNNVMTRLEELQTDPTPFPDMPALAATTARPSERVPPQPPVRATRRNSNKVRAPPVPPRKGGMRKKKLRTRRGGKQKHV